MPPGWRIDASFVADALAEAAGADLVTIDVFDTALTRTVDSPADLFAVMETDLLREIGAAASGFALSRETAEREARLATHAMRGGEEIDHDAILDRLPRGLAPFRETVRRVELEAERRALMPVPDLLALCDALRAQGRRFAFVSDMYLPAAFLEERLRACGFDGFDRVFVSAETGATKGSGRQWAVVRDAYPGARILHVGDDRHADIDLPRTLGIRTIGFERARSERRTALPFGPDTVPFSRFRRAQVLAGRAEPHAGAPSFWSALGEGWGAIVVGGFVRWLEAEVGRHGIERLYFAARDGWLLLQAWERSGAAARTGLDARYLHVARRPLNLACGFVAGTADRLDQATLGFLASSDGFVSVGTALERAGLGGIAPLLRDAEAAFGGLDTLLHWPDGTGRFEAVLQRHAPAIHAVLGGHHAALLGYLDGEGLRAPGRIGLVDLGWHATMQRSLRTLLRAAGTEPDLHGFFYGLWPPARGNRAGAGPVWSAFASDYGPEQQTPALTDAVEMLEELHTAPHGTVLGYRLDAGRWQPVHADDPRERAQFVRAAEPFGAACLGTIERLFRDGRCGTLALDDLTPGVVRATLAAVTLSPTAEERRELGGLGHHATFDHARFNTLVPDGLPADDAARDRVLRACGWRMGTAIAWTERAGAEAGPTRDWVRHVMRHYGERVLRRLG